MTKTLSPEPAGKKEAFSGRVLAQCVVARTIGDTGSQLFNPFLTIIAAGLKTNVIVLGWLVSLRSIMGLLAPLFGSLGDRYGYRIVMRCGLLACAMGALLVGICSNLIVAAVGMAVWGIGLAAFVPTLQAYLSAQLPYERRARGIGIVEYAWALAGIVGLSSMGFLIACTSWRAPFFVLSAGMAVMAIVVGRFPGAESKRIANVKTQNEKQPNVHWSKQLVDFFKLGPNAKSAYLNMVGSSLFFFAAMQVFIAHGAWLSTEYEIGPAQLGTIAMLLGFADLSGSGLVSLVTDRIGKRRSVLIGCVGAILGYLLMPLINVSLVCAVIGIAVARGSFEFAIVSNIALLSEQVPDKRGKVLTLGSSGTLIGSTVAGVSGPWLYTTYGVTGLSLVSAAATVLASILIVSFVRESADQI